MTCYLLDTNILIAAANDTSAILNSHLAKHTNDELFTSSLSWMEIYHGILRISPEGVMTHKARMYLKVFEKLESSIQIEPFTKEDAEAAAKLLRSFSSNWPNVVVSRRIDCRTGTFPKLCACLRRSPEPASSFMPTWD